MLYSFNPLEIGFSLLSSIPVNMEELPLPLRKLISERHFMLSVISFLRRRLTLEVLEANMPVFCLVFLLKTSVNC